MGGHECTCKEGYNFSMGFEEKCQGIVYIRGLINKNYVKVHACKID
jgi:hypothetical protein